MNPVVIDTNCLLQIIARHSPYRPIWDAFLAGRFDPRPTQMTTNSWTVPLQLVPIT